MKLLNPIAGQYEPPSQLGPDQRKALAHVLTSPDQFTGFRGLAGSGKSTALAELDSTLARRGWDAIFCAPTAAAADTLRKDVYLGKTMTLQKFLADANLRFRLSRGSVIVLDEAGAVGLDDMVKLFEVARLKGCRVILSGDTGQHASVNHGKEFINGERVQVREIQNDRIALADGRTLPAGFNTFTHGYAVTSHSSQSKTVDDVLLVASSKSFGAVNREQFYVSISRGRERVHVFTDDADLLARRVTDSHARKAAVELQALRDGLAKLGFIPKERLEEKAASPAMAGREDFRTVRLMRQTRATRLTRLAPVQRLAQLVEDVRRWLGEVLADGHREAATEKVVEAVKQIEPVKQAEKVAPAVKETPGQKLRREIAQRQQQQHSQRRSGGMHI